MKSNIPRTPEQIRDEIHEHQIAIAGLELECAHATHNRFQAMQWMERRDKLIRARSLEQVARMAAAVETKIQGVNA